MQKLLLRIFLFSLPLLLFLFPPLYTLISAKESFGDVDHAITDGEPHLIGYAYHEQSYDYIKWKTIAVRPKYDVIALGSSRVLEFRDSMFTAPFFNGGFAIYSINDFKPFLEGLPKEKYPAYLIIGLDQWMFNETWDALLAVPGKDKWAKSEKSGPDFLTLKSVWGDLLSGKYGFSFPSYTDSKKRYGLNANVNNKGLRNDGSMFYGSLSTQMMSGDSAVPDYRFNESFDKIVNGYRRFQYGDHVNPKAVQALTGLLELCKANHIHVIGIMPPFANAVLDSMNRSGRYGYIPALDPAIRPLFDQYGFELYDFTSPRSFGSDDTEMFDGIHGGEVTYARMLYKMLRQGSQLNHAADSAQLVKDLSHPLNRYEVYQ